MWSRASKETVPQYFSAMARMDRVPMPSSPRLEDCSRPFSHVIEPEKLLSMVRQRE